MERRPGRRRRDAQCSTAEPALLYSLLAHYARMLRDVQGARVAMGNRSGAMQRAGIGEHWQIPVAAAAADLEQLEHAIDLQLVRLARQHPLSDWIETAPGIGLPGLARLLGVTGPLDRFATVSKLWAYLGLHVLDGAAPRRRRGLRANWSPDGRVVCHQLATAIVRVGRGRYREAYDRKKLEYSARPRCGPSACAFDQVHRDRRGDVVECGAAHVHAAAMRYAVKRLVRDLWVEWRALGGGDVGAASSSQDVVETVAHPDQSHVCAAATP